MMGALVGKVIETEWDMIEVPKDGIFTLIAIHTEEDGVQWREYVEQLTFKDLTALRDQISKLIEDLGHIYGVESNNSQEENMKTLQGMIPWLKDMKTNERNT